MKRCTPAETASAKECVARCRYQGYTGLARKVCTSVVCAAVARRGKMFSGTVFSKSDCQMWRVELFLDPPAVLCSH